MKRIAFLLALLALLVLLLPLPASAQSGQRRTFLRDAETENTIRALSAPVFRAAGLDADSIRVFIVHDPSLNAFVAGGQNLFLHTGILLRAEHAGQLIGVIAHETGHIAGGHLSRVHEALRQATAQSILAMVLGAGAGAAAGRGDVAGAVMMGSQLSAARSFLQYSRDQEGAADQAAFAFLDRSGLSARGFYEFMKFIADQELLSAQRQDPYLRTHPIASERLDAAAAHLKRSPYTDAPIPAGVARMFARAKAKLHAYVDPLPTTLNRYREDDRSVESRYARAFAFYRKPDLDKALPLIDELIQEMPEDAYFRELKGQMLFENGRVLEALPEYEMAVRLYPTSALLLRDLGHVQVEANDPALLERAVQNLKASLNLERDSPSTWRQLAIAYGRQGSMGWSSLAMAEEALLRGKNKEALHHAGRAEQLLERGSPGWIQAQDVLEAARRKKDE
jgi:predicted Zn-dependent protease